MGMAIAASEASASATRAAASKRASTAWLDIAEARPRGRHSRADHDFHRFRLPVRRRGGGRARDRAWRSGRGGLPIEIAVADTIGVAVPTQVTGLSAPAARRDPGAKLARAFPQHAQYGSRQCLRRGRGGRACAGCKLRRYRRLSVRAGSHGQHPHRRSHLHASSHGIRHRRRPAGAARHQPMAATDSRSRRARHARQGRAVPGDSTPMETA